MDTSNPEVPKSQSRASEEISPELHGAADLFDNHGRRFLTECPFDGSPPPLKWKGFQHPLLRKFPKCDEKIKSVKCAGRGIEGGVFKTFVGREGSYAVKGVRLPCTGSAAAN